MADLTMPEPPHGAFVLVGETPVQHLYVRDDRWAANRGAAPFDRWFLGDGGDSGITWPQLVDHGEPVVVRLFAEDDAAIAVLEDDDEPDPLPWGIRFEVDTEGFIRLTLPPAAKVLDPAEAETVGLALVRVARHAAAGGEPS